MPILFLILLLLLTQPLSAHMPTMASRSPEIFPGYEQGLAREVTSRDLDFLELSLVSPGGSFRIHYTLSGDHAVGGELVDGIPVFVTQTALAADRVYRIMVDSLHFQPPVDDNGADGPELDIYIKNWGGTYYGVTYFGNTAPAPTYLVIDNDFAESGYTTHGIIAMQVTIAHEFFHMVQLSYSHPFNPVDNAFWYEISSVWMEEVCYPEVNDYIDYVPYNFNRLVLPALNDGQNGLQAAYGHGLFPQVLDRELGWRNGHHIMERIWAALGDGDLITALDDVISNDEWNSSLAEMLRKYGEYNSLTGSNTLAGFGYPDAAMLPEIRTTLEAPLQGEAQLDLQFMVDPLQIQTIELTTLLLGDYFLSIQDRSDPGIQMSAARIPFDTPPSLLGALSENYWTAVENLTSLGRVLVPISNADPENALEIGMSVRGSLTDLPAQIQRIFPNPWSRRSAEIVTLDYIQSVPGAIQLSLFDLAGRTVWSTRDFRAEGLQFFTIPVPDATAAGIYIVDLKSAGKHYGTKLVVLP